MHITSDPWVQGACEHCAYPVKINTECHLEIPEYQPDFKCGTFKTDKENGITPEIRSRMNQDRKRAEREQL